jgi:hypothetical protein
VAEFDAAARNQFIAYRAKFYDDDVTWEAWQAAYAAGVAAERARLEPVILHAAAYLDEVGDLCDCQGPGDHDAGCHAVLVRALRDGPRGGS